MGMIRSPLTFTGSPSSKSVVFENKWLSLGWKLHTTKIEVISPQLPLYFRPKKRFCNSASFFLASFSRATMLVSNLAMADSFFLWDQLKKPGKHGENLGISRNIYTKIGHPKRTFHLKNHWYSGDLLVIRGLFGRYILVYLPWFYHGKIRTSFVW